MSRAALSLLSHGRRATGSACKGRLFRQGPNAQTLQLPPPCALVGSRHISVTKSRRRRTFMGVAELVLEFEQALASGVRMCKDDPTYANLYDEANRLRLENDVLMEEVAELNRLRATLTEKEDAACRLALESDSEADFPRYEADLASILAQIKDIDTKLATRMTRHNQNIQDVGLLKRTMWRIGKMGDVMSLIDATEAALAEGREVAVDGPEAAALLKHSEDFGADYDYVTQAVISYREGVRQLISQLGDTGDALRELGGAPSREADQVRAKQLDHLQHMKRMLAQLSRLRDIQVFSTNEMSLLERTRAKLIRHAEVRELIKSGDKAKIGEEFRKLRASTMALRTEIEEAEVAASSHLQRALDITSKLRVLKDEMMSAETGLLRQDLFAVKDQEEQARDWLKVLRDVQRQNLQFMGLLKAAM